MPMQDVAHVRTEPNGQAQWHSLAEHLESVATSAAAYADCFGSSDWAYYIGLLHDLGKFHPDWQAYLRSQPSHDPNVRKPKGPRHSGVGAIAALERFQQCAPARTIAYCIAGHHAGLADWYGDLDHRLTIEERERAYYECVRALPHVEQFLTCTAPTSQPPPWKDAPEQLHLWVRMLFSCLVDADILDTERFMQPDVAAERGRYPQLDQLRTKFEQYIEQLECSAPQTLINEIRKEIHRQCRAKAALEPGFFSLVVPTGGGKTLASVAFALEHAWRYGHQRIIVAIPYTSIIEQTGAVLRYGSDSGDRDGELFGDAVVEHHSNFDPIADTPDQDELFQRARLATENWDAPIIVTTTVQLFESLLGCRPSQVRKLHNIARSVIILDEAQLLPSVHLRPILSVLQGLVDYFGCTVVLMTATLPTFEGTIGAPPNVLKGLSGVRAIIENPNDLAQKLDRVELTVEKKAEEKLSWDELAQILSSYEQVLCIVNSRKDCRDLHRLMPEGTFLLSTLLCGQHRSHRIREIKERLRRGEPVRVISTQLIEAGVDIDFPVVYRALAGLDSIAQAAGRCNREQRLPTKGRVVVFRPPTRIPQGVLSKAEDATSELLRTRQSLALSPEYYEAYFKSFFRRVNSFDEAGFDECLVRDARKFIFQFRSFAEKFHIVDDRARENIVVWYTDPTTGIDSRSLIDEICHGRATYRTWRMLQRYVVSLFRNEVEQLARRGYITKCENIWVQNIEQLYDRDSGLQLDERTWFDDFVV